MEKAIELIEEALQSAIEHPTFLGFRDEITEEDIIDEGGDAAFVTADIAWRLQEALDILKTLKIRTEFGLSS
jgi:hypothetical protein